jgi:hypothetical protein
MLYYFLLVIPVDITFSLLITVLSLEVKGIEDTMSHSVTCDMWILTAQNPAVVPVYNSIDMERRLVREAHLAEEIG